MVEIRPPFQCDLKWHQQDGNMHERGQHLAHPIANTHPRFMDTQAPASTGPLTILRPASRCLLLLLKPSMIGRRKTGFRWPHWPARQSSTDRFSTPVQYMQLISPLSLAWTRLQASWVVVWGDQPMNIPEDIGIFVRSFPSDAACRYSSACAGSSPFCLEVMDRSYIHHSSRLLQRSGNRVEARGHEE